MPVACLWCPVFDIDTTAAESRTHMLRAVTGTVTLMATDILIPTLMPTHIRMSTTIANVNPSHQNEMTP